MGSKEHYNLKKTVIWKWDQSNNHEALNLNKGLPDSKNYMLDWME